jgi:hypothetical protein
VALTNCYCTLSDLKTSLAIEDIQDDTGLEAAILTASRMIDDYTGRFFYRDGTTAAPVTRYYTPDSWYITNLDDFVSLNQIALDDDFDQTYTTILATSDYLIDPVNNARRGWPYTRITAIDRYIFPYAYPQSVRVQAVWGWPSIPAEIAMATKIQASRLFIRRQSPFGIAGTPELGTVRLTSRLDPDVEALIRPFRKMNGLVA